MMTKSRSRRFPASSPAPALPPPPPARGGLGPGGVVDAAGAQVRAGRQQLADRAPHVLHGPISSGRLAERERRRAPAAVVGGLHLDRAAPAAEGPALRAARPLRRPLERHPALARRVHGVSSSARRAFPRPFHAARLACLHSRARRAAKQRYCFYIRDKISLSIRQTPRSRAWRSLKSRRSSRSAPSAASAVRPTRCGSLSRR